MQSRSWIAVFAFTVFLSMSPIVIFNYMMDPLGTFEHVNAYNNVRPVLNERQVKTNMLYYQGMKKYDSILLGSSRTSFVDQNSFKGMKVFNYALDSMHPSEYKGYIDFAKEIKGSEFKNIIMGLDFYGSSVLGDFWRDKNKDASYYIDIVKQPLYRYKMLMSYNTAKRSYINYKSNKNRPITFYNRYNVKFRQKLDEKRRKEAFTSMLKIHKEFFQKNYKYLDNGRYSDIFYTIKRDNPNTNFIVYTTPMTAQLFQTFMGIGLLDDYKRWLKELVQVFGQVHHFMNVNSVTLNVQNYSDDDHLYPEIANMIGAKLSHDENVQVPADFGVILTAENIDSYLDGINLQSISAHIENSE